jgi:hypothetical protein
LRRLQKQGHFDKFDEWKNYLPAVFAENDARALPTKAASYGSAKTFVALPPLVARYQQAHTYPPNGGGVAYGARQVSQRKSKHTAQTRRVPQASRKPN